MSGITIKTIFKQNEARIANVMAAYPNRRFCFSVYIFETILIPPPKKFLMYRMTVFCWGTLHKPHKHFIKVATVIKSAVTRYF